ncbi:hypothetical protein ACV242_005514 [Peribacillus simplex]
MNNINTKILSGTIASILLAGTVSVPFANAKEHSQQPVNYSQNVDMSELTQDDFYKALEIAILKNQNDFKDPSIAKDMSNNIRNAQSQKNVNTLIQTQGKLTMSAKAGATAIKAVMNKVGQTAWDKMVKTVESLTGTQLVVLHWTSIHGLLDFLVNSGDTIEVAMTKFLVKKGFNSTVAKYVAKTFILFIL